MSPAQVSYIRHNRAFDVLPYWYQEHYNGNALSFLKEVLAAMYGSDWYDNSDVQTDYFDTAFYIDVNIGNWNKPYIFTA